VLRGSSRTAGLGHAGMLRNLVVVAEVALLLRPVDWQRTHGPQLRRTPTHRSRLRFPPPVDLS
jgi:hypothetical protein